MASNILISLPDDVARILTMRARRFGYSSRRKLIAGLCTVVARGIEEEPQAEAAEPGAEVQDIFSRLSAHEAPQYGQRPVRHFNKLR